MSAERQLHSEFGNDTLDRFIFAAMGRMKILTVVEKPMTKAQIAAYLDYSQSQIDKLVRAGIIKAHRMEDGSDPRYLASEVLERLKAS